MKLKVKRKDTKVQESLKEHTILAVLEKIAENRPMITTD